jgi:hypothetical protein
MPPIPDPALIVVIVTVMWALGSSALLAGWAEGRVSRVGVAVGTVAVAGVFWIWQQMGLSLSTVPTAFIEITARIIR